MQQFQQYQTQAVIAQIPNPTVPAIHQSTDVIATMVGVFGSATLGAIAWVFRSVVANYNKRFEKVETQINAISNQLAVDHKCIETKIDGQEKALLILRAELPVTYTRSEDFIRFVNMLDAKIDSLHRKIDGAMINRD